MGRSDSTDRHLPDDLKRDRRAVPTERGVDKRMGTARAERFNAQGRRTATIEIASHVMPEGRHIFLHITNVDNGYTQSYVMPLTEWAKLHPPTLVRAGEGIPR